MHLKIKEPVNRIQEFQMMFNQNNNKTNKTTTTTKNLTLKVCLQGAGGFTSCRHTAKKEFPLNDCQLNNKKIETMA